MMGRARFKPSRRLEEQLAALVAPVVTDVAKKVAEKAKGYAPPTKIWQTREDERVRVPHHAEAHDQEVPENLRFDLRSFDWDMEHGKVPGPRTYLLKPKDEVTYGEIVNTINCRCVKKPDPDGIAKLIDHTEAQVFGKKASAVAFAEGKWVITAEIGTTYPGGLVADGAYYMRRAANAVAAEHRAGQ